MARQHASTFATMTSPALSTLKAHGTDPRMKGLPYLTFLHSSWVLSTCTEKLMTIIIIINSLQYELPRVMEAHHTLQGNTVFCSARQCIKTLASMSTWSRVSSMASHLHAIHTTSFPHSQKLLKLLDTKARKCQQ